MAIKFTPSANDPALLQELTFEDGTKMTEKDLLGLVEKGKNLESDYTKKTQALAKDREKLKDMEDFANYLDANPELASVYQEGFKLHRSGKKIKLIPMGSEAPPKKEGEEDDPDPVTGLQKKFDDLSQRIDQKEQSEQMERDVAQQTHILETTLAAMEKQYPAMRKNEVLAVIAANPKADIEELCKSSHEAELKGRDSIIKDFLKAKEEGDAVIVRKGGQQVLNLKNQPKTMAEARAVAAKIIEQANRET